MKQIFHPLIKLLNFFHFFIKRIHCTSAFITSKGRHICRCIFPIWDVALKKLPQRGHKGEKQKALAILMSPEAEDNLDKIYEPFSHSVTLAEK